ncbi:MAG: OB-fold nucleic acid binding domain-containing protein, partial [Candidatus Paceibacterales bacterium]
MFEKDNPVKAEKRRKLHELRKAGINPYPYTFDKNATAEGLKDKFIHLKAGEHPDSGIFKVAGRVMTVRLMGKAAFFNLQDQTGVIQVYLKTTELPAEDAKVFDLLDLGDIVGIEGTVFCTKTGEITVKANHMQMLCKTLEPLPDKHAGLADVEIKYRARYLDLITSPESRKVFEMRSKIIAEVRNFLNSRGFMEVETPVLQPIYGGAAAHPFTTHH